MDFANKAHFAVVLNALELGIVDAEFFDEAFRFITEDGSHGVKSKTGLSSEPPGFLPGLVDYSVVEGFDAPFIAPLTLVCKKRPIRKGMLARRPYHGVRSILTHRCNVPHR